jgi:hypothetical protein
MVEMMANDKPKDESIIFCNHRVWIYGIGVIGKRVCRLFYFFNIQIKGILVTAKKGNISNYFGIPVFEFDRAEIEENDVIVVTAAGKAQSEICNNVSSKGFNYIVWSTNHLQSLWKSCKYVFEDRRQDRKKACIVLSGYKELLWDGVFDRLKTFCPKDIDICICSAGKYSDTLSGFSRKNGWSYLSTEVNSVSLTQNIAISLFPDADWIYKMDEDMFITEGTLENMLTASEQFILTKPYQFGLCSALIPVNGIGYRIFLNKYDLLDDYQNRFGAAIIGGNPKSQIECNPETAEFMWSQLPQIDTMATDATNEDGITICNTRLSIGLILFQRELWEYMQGFLVYGSMDLGIDEEDINAFCINNSRAMIIADNAIAGHFGFGKQNADMTKFYTEHIDLFRR